MEQRSTPVLLDLSEAAQIMFGDKRKKRALQTEIGKGRLVASKIANTYYVTEKALEDMRKLCQGKESQQDSTCTQKSASTSSETAKPISAQDMARDRLSLLKKNLRPTQQGNGSQKPKSQAQVVCLVQPR